MLWGIDRGIRSDVRWDRKPA